ncbi:Ig-like domain-containing protein [Buttiauxella sp. BIGb0552]|uniref:Ig-like domain-containing protein n=1 Tax=Buttiauxella sp. BIGb0552 TaxID=2485120 RepID=UPI0024453965|nr:Ig-like domain-containing protein [Buttiauxella sp. BIGb0552]
MHATITSHDDAGNEVIATQDNLVTIDNHANTTIIIDDVTQDNVLNHDELAAKTQWINGVVDGDAKVHDRIDVEINGNHFKGEVIDLGGNQLGYKIAVDPRVFSNNKGEVDGSANVHVTVTSHDKAGNEVIVTQDHTVAIDNHANATITVDSVTDDNTLNHTELEHQTQTITGTVGGDAKPNDEVILTINGNQHKGVVVETPDGHFVYSVDVPTSEFGNNQSEVNADKPFTVQVTSHDKANNEVVVTTEHRFHLDNHADNSVIIKTVAGDNVVNHAEHQHDTDITGHVSGKDAKIGDVVEVTVHGNSYFGTVFEGAGGRLLYNVPVPRDMLQEGKNDVQVKVSSYDKAGNEALAIEHQNVEVDTAAHASITIENITKDDVLNHSELNDNQQWIHGKVGLDARLGDVIDIQIGTQHVYGVVETFADNSLGYRIPVDPSLFSDNKGEQDTSVTFHVSVTSHDKAGNVFTKTEEHTVDIDNHANATIDIKVVADDNFLNHSELNHSVQTITGEVHGDAREGDKVTLEVNGKPYFGRVTEISPGHLGYHIDVKSSDFSDNQGEVDKYVKVTVKVESHDDHGNFVTATSEHKVTIDNHANATLTIEKVTDDNLLNNTELTQDHQVISGVAGGDAKPGDHVVITVNGIGYPGTVGKDMSYHIPVPSSQFNDNKNHVDGDLKFTAKITSHDAAGNEVIVTAEHTVHLDNFAVNDFTIETVAGDDWVSKIESRSNTMIRGAVTGDDAKPGDIVKVTVSGVDANGKPDHHDYSGTVHVDSNGNLFYSVPVPPGGLYEGLDTVTVQVTSQDLHGNSITTTHTHDIAVDTHADATIHIDNVTADDVLNHDELAQPKVMITGVVDGDAKVGDDVVIEVNTYKYSGQVVDLGNGHLGFRIPVDNYAISDNQGNIDTNVTFKASVTSFDELHNKITATTEHTAHIDNHADGNITMGSVTGDNIINHHESREHTTKVSGTVSGEVQEGDKVIVTVNDHSYETTVVKLPNQHGALGYSVDVSTKDLMADQDPTAHVVAHDHVGNEHLIDITNHIDIDLQAEATITIDPVTGDSMINAAEAKAPFTYVTGVVGGPDVKEGDIVHLGLKGPGVTDLNLTGTVHFDSATNSYKYNIKVGTHDLMTHPDLTASVTVTDVANNTASAQDNQHVIVDLNVEAVITVDNVTRDNILNGEELEHVHTLVTGTVTGEMKPGDPLNLKINNHDYPGVVVDLGKDAQGNQLMGYRVWVDTADLQASPNIHASIDVTDKAGNERIATNDHHVDLKDHADASLTINVVSGDDVLNKHDLIADETTVNGRVFGDVHNGDIVYVHVNGHEYKAVVGSQAELNGDLGYSLKVKTADLAADSRIKAHVETEDVAHNHASATATHTVFTDDSVSATISIDPVTADGVINNAEAHLPTTTITGVVTGDVHLNDRVSLDVNGAHYYGNVIDLGSGKGLGYSIDVSTDDLISKKIPQLHASVTGYDAVGNTVLAQADQAVGVDTWADADITINLDNSKANGVDFWVVTGRVGGDVKAGDTVTLTVGGHTYTTTVYTETHNGPPYLAYRADENSVKDTNGDHVLIPRHANNEYITAQITGHDPYDNNKTVTGVAFAQGSNDHSVLPPYVDPSHPHSTDVHITISPIAGDNVINKDELAAGKTVIRGTVSGDVQPGDIVTVHIGTQDIPVVVTERPNLPGELGYEIEVDTKYLVDNPYVSASVNSHTDNNLVFGVQKPVGVDKDADVEIHLAPIAGDNVINIAEAASGKTIISGTVKGDGIHDGSNVTITVNGHDMTVQVVEDKTHNTFSFSKEVSIDELRLDPHVTASVTGYDDHGNVTTKADNATVTVDTKIEATVSINSVTSDDILNTNETHQAKTTISGTVTGDIDPNTDTITLHINGVEHTNVKIAPDKSYSLEVDTTELTKGVADGGKAVITADVTGHDDSGNTLPVHADHYYSIDTSTAATITTYVVSGDDILSKKDLGATQTEISGTVSGDADIGDAVTVILNGKTSTAYVARDSITGELGYTLKVTTSDLEAELRAEAAAKPGVDPEITVTVTGTDGPGNSFSESVTRSMTIDDHADVVLTVNPVAVDNTLNAVESQKSTTEISGKVTGDVKAGDNVIVTVNGHELPAVLKSDGNGGLTFKLDVPTSDLLQDQHITYKVMGVDGVGNTVEHTEVVDLKVDQVADNSIKIDIVAGDDKVNVNESHNPTTMVHGVVTGDAFNGTVTITVNDKVITIDAKDAVIVDDGTQKTFSVPVPTDLLVEGTNKVEVTVNGFDEAGNPAHSTDTHTITLDTTIGAHITLEQATQNDDVINAKEADNVSIQGTVDGDAQPGDPVNMTVNGHPYTGLLDANKHFSIPVLRGDLQEGGNRIVVDVAVKDDAGNTFTAHTEHDVLMDTHLNAAIHLDNVAGNNVINAKEVDHVSVTGTIDRDTDAQLGDHVTVTVNGKSFPGEVKVINGHLGYDIHVDKGYLHEGTNTFDVSVSATDAAGNAITVHDSHDVHVDTQLGATITLEPVAANDVINAAAADHVSVTGTVSTDSDAKLGDEVTVTVNGKSFTGEVKEINGHPGYDIHVDKGYLHEGTNTFDVSIKATDGAGNEITVHAGHDVQVDTQLDATITLEPVAANDVINAAAADHVSVTGTVGTDSDAKLGHEVTVTVNGKSFTGVVQDINGHLGYNIPVDKGYLHEGSNTFDVSIKATDGAGNEITVHAGHEVLMDTHLNAAIHLDNVAGNNVINAKEVDHVSVTGTIDRDTDAQLGDHVTVTINHQSFTGVVSVINGHLGYDIPVDKGYLQDGKNTFDVSINATDKAGNAITVHDSHDVLVDTHADAKITIDKVTGDDHIDSQEARHHVTHITGQIDSADVHNNEHINVTINDKHYDVILHEDNGHLTYDVPVNTNELHIGKNSVGVSVIANDDHGNTNVIHQNADFTMDDPSHRGKHDVDGSDKSHHAANAHSHDNGLSNLFDDSHDTFSFNLAHDSKGHHGDESLKIFTGKENHGNEKVDLSDLAHELHEGTDITQMIKGGDAHHGKGGASAADAPSVTPAHGGDAHHASFDSAGAATHSLDHLIPKPEHYHS